MSQQALFADFLEFPNNYTKNSEKISSFPGHGDGYTERWQFQLSLNFYVYVDCPIHVPWSTTDDQGYFGSCMVIGYKLGEEIYLIC